MPSRRLQPDRTATPSFVQPVLNTLRRMRESVHVRPDQVTEQATALLHEHFGPSRRPAEAVFAHGSIGLFADHTHYFDGFALLMTLPQGVAVAVRPATKPHSRIVVECGSGIHTAELVRETDLASVADSVIRIAGESAARVLTDESALELAVVSTMPPGTAPGRDAAVAVATVRAIVAMNAMATRANDRLLEEVAAIEAATGAPFSNAYVQSATVKEDRRFVLVDTATLESIALEVPAAQRPGFLLLHTSGRPESQRHSDMKRRTRAEDALAALKGGGFDRIDGFRDLMHRDLERAMSVAPRKLRSAVSYLVTENGRVQKAVAAIRRNDWQMFGALMLMSHAARTSDWQVSSPEADFVVSEAEQMSLEGIYGASQIGDLGETVLVAGQPFSVPPFLDRIRPGFSERFNREPAATLI